MKSTGKARVACLAFLLANACTVEIAHSQQRRTGSVVEYTKELLCRSNEFKPVMTCIGRLNVEDILADNPSRRAALIGASTKLRMQVTQLDKMMGNLSHIVNRHYADEYGSIDDVVARSGAAEQCLGYYDQRNRRDALKALACGYPIPQRFDFSKWVRNITTDMRYGHLFSKVQFIYLSLESGRCKQYIENFIVGNKLALFVPARPRPLSSDENQKIKAGLRSIKELTDANPGSKDEINFMLNALDGDCDRYLP